MINGLCEGMVCVKVKLCFHNLHTFPPGCQDRQLTSTPSSSTAAFRGWTTGVWMSMHWCVPLDMKELHYGHSGLVSLCLQCACCWWPQCSHCNNRSGQITKFCLVQHPLPSAWLNHRSEHYCYCCDALECALCKYMMSANGGAIRMPHCAWVCTIQVHIQCQWQCYINTALHKSVYYTNTCSAPMASSAPPIHIQCWWWHYTNATLCMSVCYTNTCLALMAALYKNNSAHECVLYQYTFSANGGTIQIWQHQWWHYTNTTLHMSVCYTNTCSALMAALYKYDSAHKCALYKYMFSANGGIIQIQLCTWVCSIQIHIQHQWQCYIATLLVCLAQASYPSRVLRPQEWILKPMTLLLKLGDKPWSRVPMRLLQSTGQWPKPAVSVLMEIKQTSLRIKTELGWAHMHVDEEYQGQMLKQLTNGHLRQLLEQLATWRIDTVSGWQQSMTAAYLKTRLRA